MSINKINLRPVIQVKLWAHSPLFSIQVIDDLSAVITLVMLSSYGKLLAKINFLSQGPAHFQAFALLMAITCFMPTESISPVVVTGKIKAWPNTAARPMTACQSSGGINMSTAINKHSTSLS